MPDSPVSPEAKTQQLHLRGNRLSAELKKVLVAKNHARAREVVVDLIANAAELGTANANYSPLSAPLDLVLTADSYARGPIYTDLVRLLLDAGALVNPSFTQTATPLLAALRSGNAEVAAIILDAGADFKRSEAEKTVGGSDTKSMLVWAIESKQNAAALRMIKGGADVHGDPLWPRPLQAAARMGNLEIIKALVERGAKVNAQFPDAAKPHVHNARYYPSETALMEAAGKPDNPVVPYLLKNGADIKALNDLGFNALHHSTSTDYSSGVAVAPTPFNVELLLKAGADVNAADKWGRTPLHWAIQHLVPFDDAPIEASALRILKLLLDAGANPDSAALIQPLPLKDAVSRRSVQTAVLLLQAGANRDDLGDKLKVMALEGDTPAHQELKRLLKDEPLDPDNLRSIFEAAVGRNDLNRVKTLLAQGYSALTFPDSVALHIACQEGHRKMLELLLRAGFNPNFNSPKVNGTPLIVAVQNRADRYDKPNMGATQLSAWTLEGLVADNLANVRALLDAGAELEPRNSAGNTALHFAVRYAAPPIVQLLLEHGANVHARTDEGKTPLLSLMIGGRLPKIFWDNPQITGRFYSAEADDKFMVRQEREQLARAIEWDEAIAEMLLKAGADVNAVGDDTYSVLEIAVILSTPNIVQLLLKEKAVIGDVAQQSQELASLVVEKGRSARLIKASGFKMGQFPWLKEGLIQSAQGEAALENVISNAELHFRYAIEQDVIILQILHKFSPPKL